MTQTVPDISPLMPMHQDPLLVCSIPYAWLIYIYFHFILQFNRVSNAQKKQGPQQLTEKSKPQVPVKGMHTYESRFFSTLIWNCHMPLWSFVHCFSVLNISLRLCLSSEAFTVIYDAGPITLVTVIRGYCCVCFISCSDGENGWV